MQGSTNVLACVCFAPRSPRALRTDHVLKVNEGVVDSDDLGTAVDDRVTEDDTADTTETEGSRSSG